MEQVLDVIYSNGVFTPLEPIDLPEHKRMTITLHLPSEEALLAKPRTPLGYKLQMIRTKIVTSEVSLLDWTDIEREVAERQGRGYHHGTWSAPYC